MSKTFGENLRFYRTSNHMTQADLANSAGVTRSSVNNYEIGAAEPSFQVLCRFADILGTDLDSLIMPRTDKPALTRALVTDDEAFLLKIYRNADATYRSVAVDILRMHQQGGK